MINTEEYIYCGIPTFMSSPYVNVSQAKSYDVAVVGVPIDFGASYRLGVKYAPRAIREFSAWDRVDGKVYYDLDSEKRLKSNHLKICDVGDINIWPTDPQKNSAEIVDVVSRIRKHSFPLILGGDHSITYSTFLACAKALSHKDKKIGLIHFDAHLDTESNYLTMPDIWHGNPFRKLIDDGILSGKRMITIGPRGIVDEDWYKYVTNNEITLFTSQQVKRQGIKNVISNVINAISKDTDYVFLSIDIDCIDISQAPGTGTPQSGGITAQELIQAIRMLHEVPIIGADIVEVNPKLDQSGATVVTACEILFNLLAFTVNKDLKL